MGKYTKEELKEIQRQNGFAHANNLIALKDRPKEEELEIRRKGHKAMMEVKKKRKNIKEILDIIGGLDASGVARDYVSPQLIEKLEAVSEDITVYDLINLKQTENALKGSTKSAEFVRDSLGERPKDNIQVDVDIITDSDRALIESIQGRLDSLEAIDNDNA